MKRNHLAVITAAVVATLCGLLIAPAPQARAASPCWVTGKVPVVNSQGHLNTHFAVSCPDGASWTVDATVQALVNGSWQRAGNTFVATVANHGDLTVSAEVDTGAWACASGRLYRSHAVLRNGNSDNSASITLC